MVLFVPDLCHVPTSVRSFAAIGAAVDATWSVDGYGEWIVDTGFVCRKTGL